ncbi:MAG: aspartate--tRNA ligase [bacterium]|nr:aspartate--tRNA ligase [bacterium]
MKREWIKTLSEKGPGTKVLLSGWVDSKRDLGNLVFIYLRDVTGMIQVIFDSEKFPEVWESAKDLKAEWVISVSGATRPRPDSNVKAEDKLGSLEFIAETLTVLNKSKILPFELKEGDKIKEELRLKYRYLDLRRKELKDNIIFKNEVFFSIRDFLHKHNFFEIETPILIKSTPEGARDFIVPARNFKGKFYALPQSPQILKQLLQISGFERYYQMARCFRDEDLRADRQPEFTQLDIEMSFVTEEDILSIVEEMIGYLFKTVMKDEIALPFKRLTYKEVMSRFGTDKPDLRFGLELEDFTSAFEGIDFQVLKSVISSGQKIMGIRVEDVEYFSRKNIDKLTEELKNFKIPGMIFIKKVGEDISSSIKKFLTDDILNRIHLDENQTVLLLAGAEAVILPALGYLRERLGKELNLIKSGFEFLWVVEFPLLELDPETGSWTYKHHPFTQASDSESLFHNKDLGNIKAKAYDLVLNGAEVAGGSIRNHDPEIQKQVFKLLNISEEIVTNQFGFLIEALESGAPPHGGIAFGMERFVAQLLNIESIRDVMAFPKTTSGTCLMTGAPDFIFPDQLKDLNLEIKE